VDVAGADNEDLDCEAEEATDGSWIGGRSSRQIVMGEAFWFVEAEGAGVGACESVGTVSTTIKLS
jgi:hypothetical protein